MRGNIKHYNFGRYRFDVYFDTGAGPDDQYTVWVYDHAGEPVRGENGWCVRRCFAEFVEPHVQNFCKKFASDSAYRSTFIAEWKSPNVLL